MDMGYLSGWLCTCKTSDLENGNVYRPSVIAKPLTNLSKWSKSKHRNNLSSIVIHHLVADLGGPLFTMDDRYFPPNPMVVLSPSLSCAAHSLLHSRNQKLGM